jgi:hypothetical protein
VLSIKIPRPIWVSGRQSMIEEEDRKLAEELVRSGGLGDKKRK